MAPYGIATLSYCGSVAIDTSMISLFYRHDLSRPVAGHAGPHRTCKTVTQHIYDLLLYVSRKQMSKITASACAYWNSGNILSATNIKVFGL